MKPIRLLKYFVFFLGLALIEGVCFPFVVNHAQFDLRDKHMQPYIVKGFVMIAGIAYVILLMNRRPSTDTSVYAAGKIIFPVMIAILLLNLAEFFPANFNPIAITIMALKITGIATALWLWVLFFRGRELQ